MKGIINKSRNLFLIWSILFDALKKKNWKIEYLSFVTWIMCFIFYKKFQDEIKIYDLSSEYFVVRIPTNRSCVLPVCGPHNPRFFPEGRGVLFRIIVQKFFGATHRKKLNEHCEKTRRWTCITTCDVRWIKQVQAQVSVITFLNYV